MQVIQLTRLPQENDEKPPVNVAPQEYGEGVRGMGEGGGQISPPSEGVGVGAAGGDEVNVDQRSGVLGREHLRGGRGLQISGRCVKNCTVELNKGGDGVLKDLPDGDGEFRESTIDRIMDRV